MNLILIHDLACMLKNLDTKPIEVILIGFDSVRVLVHIYPLMQLSLRCRFHQNGGRAQDVFFQCWFEI